jgi:hypothetical protein
MTLRRLSRVCVEMRTSLSGRVLPALVLALALAGCVTATNTMRPDDLANLRLESVAVGYAPNARLAWGDGERAYAATKGLPAHESDKVANTPELAAYMRNAIGGKIKTAMERDLGPKLKGSRPVRVRVEVKSVNIPSAVQRILIGGGNTMVADVTLHDARTGAVLLNYSEQSAASMAGQGVLGVVVDAALLPDPVDRVADSYARQYSAWLLQTSTLIP